MLKKQILSTIALVAACAAAAPTMASDNPWYGVFSLGSSQLQANSASVDFYDVNNGFASSTTSSSSASVSGKAQLGYMLGKTFSLEGGYTYLGKANFTSITNLGAIGGSQQVNLANLDLVAKIPFAMEDKLSVLGRFGGYYWKTKSEMPNAVTRGNATVNDNGYDFKIGAGLQYQFTPTFSMRGEYERFNGVGNSQTSGDNKVNQWTVGAVLKF
jgi:OOP family OmpA-OmpF porin